MDVASNPTGPPPTSPPYPVLPSMQPSLPSRLGVIIPQCQSPRNPMADQCLAVMPFEKATQLNKCPITTTPHS